MNLDLFELVASTVLILIVKRIFEWLTSSDGPISKWKERLRANQKWMWLRYRVKYPWDSERRERAEFRCGLGKLAMTRDNGMRRVEDLPDWARDLSHAA